MRVAGTRDLPAPPERVWEALTDAEVLAIALPGCHRVEGGPPTRLTLGWRLAALDGVYMAAVGVDDSDPPTAATLRVSARGEPGALDAVLRARLSEHDSGTRLDWEAEYEASDGLAAVGGRVLEAALRRQADGLLDGVARHLTGPALGAEPAPAAPSPAAPVAEPSRPATWGPFEDGPAPDTGRALLAAAAGALLALLLMWAARRLRSAR